jgi:diamine N-acetyltransferase
MLSLEANICRLRALEPSDVDMLYLWENDPEVWRVSGTVAPLSYERLCSFVQEQNYDIYATRQMRLVVEAEGVAVGTVDIFDFDPQHLRFGVGVLIYAQENRRRGYARAALEAVAGYAREVLGLKQIWASVASDNVASVALFESLGFERCGLRRDWLRRGAEYVDVYEYQLLLI